MKKLYTKKITSLIVICKRKINFKKKKKGKKDKNIVEGVEAPLNPKLVQQIHK
jgi:hypothetical protein